MACRVRAHVPTLLLAALAVWVMTYLGLYGFGWNDYSSEAKPAFDALIAGHVWTFLTLAPGYGGSLELRAPLALLPGLWGGGELAVYRAVSIPCLIAAAALAVWLVGAMRVHGYGPGARAVAFALCAANPATLSVLQYGHPEELLGGVLCVSAVLAAQRDRPGWAGILLGLAIVNKQWALLAVGPVALALPGGHRRALLASGLVVVGGYTPLLLPSLFAHGGTGTAPVLASSGGGAIFQPWQLWWFFGSHGHPVIGAFGDVKIGFRTPPAWIQSASHPIVVAVALPATLLALRSRARDPMLLLALLFAMRCALDTWDNPYYPMPFLLALLAWEALRSRRPAVLSLLATFVVWLVYVNLFGRVTPDMLALLFTLIAVPTIVALALALYAPGAFTARFGGSGHRRRAHAAGSSAPAGTPIPTV